MTRSRTFWLALLLLGVTAGGLAVILRRPDPGPALDCRAEDVRWVDAGTGVVAVCAPGGAGLTPPAGQALTLGLKMDLNRATEAELALVPGIGPSLARSLVEARQKAGRFETWEEVDAVRGIGPAKLQALESAAEIRP